jgi:hypothetical protein
MTNEIIIATGLVHRVYILHRHSTYLPFIYLKSKKDTHGIVENVFVTETAKWPKMYASL